MKQFLYITLFTVLLLQMSTSHAWKYSPLFKRIIVSSPVATSAYSTSRLIGNARSKCSDSKLELTRSKKSLPHSKDHQFNYDNIDPLHNFTNNINSTPYHSVEGGAWFPITLLDTIDDKFPKQIEILGNKYVVWRNQQEKNNASAAFGWNVMLDQCPHRLAPLSEGRVDPRTNCLECPYHGWQFEAHTGTCTFVPQSPRSSINEYENVVRPSKNRFAMVPSYPVHFTPNILWAYLPMLHSNVSFPTLPEQMLPALNSAKSFFSREVPYSFDVALENFMDPAHVPFAHHMLSNHRKQGTPLNIQITNFTSKELTFLYERSLTTNMKLTALYSFYAPCYYQIRLFRSRESKENIDEVTSDDFRNVLSLVVAPIAPGRSRVFVILPRAVGIASKFLPKWFQHRFWLKFFDSDIWLHNQEQVIQSTANVFEVNNTNSHQLKDGIVRKFTLMTTSDRGVRAWRKFWEEHM